MTKQVIKTDKAPGAVGPYSQDMARFSPPEQLP